jgi:hypothetical protein
MEIEIFEKAFIENLNKNFPKQSKYFDFRLRVFCEFKTLIFEINKCLILEFHRASITLTNNLLERLLKLALIYNEVGIGPKPIEKWNEIFKIPNEKYLQIELANSIEKCKKYNLITEIEKQFLFNKIRVLMRNGFSHADSTHILSKFPDNTVMYKTTFDNPSIIQEVGIDQKLIPEMQSLQMQNFAKENSLEYFDYIYNLIFKIEDRLLEKTNKTST